MAFRRFVVWLSVAGLAAAVSLTGAGASAAEKDPSGMPLMFAAATLRSGMATSGEVGVQSRDAGGLDYVVLVERQPARP